MRTLYYVPTVHSEFESVDTGDRPPLMTTAGLKLLQEAVDILKCWHRVRMHVERMVANKTINLRKTFAYSDGLPQGHRLQLDREPHQMFQPTTATLIWLEQQGVRIRGTEDPLLMKEQELFIRTALKGLQREARRTNRNIVVRRDEAIARHIAQDLPPGHTGLLFMGAAHRVDIRLRVIAPDIRIRLLRMFDRVMSHRYRRP